MEKALNDSVERLLRLAYEYEGLLALAQRRGEYVPADVWAMLAEKAAALHSATDTLASTALPPAAEERDAPPEVAPEGAQPVAEVAPEEAPAPEVEKAPADEAPADAPTTEESPDEEPLAEEPPAEGEPAEAEPTDDDRPEEELEEEPMDEEPMDEEPMDEEPMEEEPIEEEEPAATLTIGDKLSREGSRNLRRAFSVNDRFRFRRELFGNSDIEMSDTINLVEAMSSYEEAIDYFMTDLQWDGDNPEVRDFLAIIEKHFTTR